MPFFCTSRETLSWSELWARWGMGHRDPGAALRPYSSSSKIRAKRKGSCSGIHACPGRTKEQPAALVQMAGGCFMRPMLAVVFCFGKTYIAIQLATEKPSRT